MPGKSIFHAFKVTATSSVSLLVHLAKMATIPYLVLSANRYQLLEQDSECMFTLNLGEPITIVTMCQHACEGSVMA